jgi:hypothetical protein
VLNLFLGQGRPNCSWASSRRAAELLSGWTRSPGRGAVGRKPDCLAAADPEALSAVGTAFGAEGIAIDSVNALTDAAITVPHSVASRDSETSAAFFDDAYAGG